MKCSKCGGIINPNDLFCQSCGNKIEKKEPTKIKKNNKVVVFLIIGIIVALIIGLFCGKYFLATCKCDCKPCSTEETEKKTTNTQTSASTYTFDLLDPSKIEISSENDNEKTKNIEILNIFVNKDGNSYSAYRQAKVYGKNNNSEAVTIAIYFDYYDSEGYRIDRSSNIVTIMGNKEFVISVNAFDDSKNYDYIKLIYAVRDAKSYYKFPNESELEINSSVLSNGNIKTIVTNNSNIIINTSAVACIYLKDNKVVFANDAYSSEINIGSSAEATCYDYALKSTQDSSKNIDYDNYRIVLQYAYNYE